MNSGILNVVVYEIGTKTNWKKWEQYKAYVENFKTCYIQLTTNTAFKKFCFDCRKAVNLPVNSLAGKGEDDTKVLPIIIKCSFFLFIKLVIY